MGDTMSVPAPVTIADWLSEVQARITPNGIAN